MGWPTIMFLCRSFLVVVLSFVSGVSPAFAQQIESSASYLGTTVDVTACYPASRQGEMEGVMAAVWERVAGIHALLNRFDPDSDVSRLNISGAKRVKIHQDVYTLLLRSREYARLTDGAFDITTGSLTAFWKQAARDNVFPAPEDVRRAKRSVGVQYIEFFEGSFVRIPSWMKIDLGGLAAGFAADEAARILRSRGIVDFLINAGGEIYAAGVSCDGGPWRVAVRHPLDPGRYLDILELKDQALSTSGNYEKYMEIAGQRWSHIINPLTGYPQLGVRSSTVVSPSAIDADVLSTALSILGPGEGLKLIDLLGKGYAAMLLFDHGNALEQQASEGYAVLKVK